MEREQPAAVSRDATLQFSYGSACAMYPSLTSMEGTVGRFDQRISVALMGK